MDAFIVIKQIIGCTYHIMNNCKIWHGLTLWQISISFTALSIGILLFKFFFAGRGDNSNDN